MASEEESQAAAEEAALAREATLSRKTDPVRMYMRDAGSFELITRYGEIEIAKRIEAGLRDMLLAIASAPPVVAKILSLGERTAAGELNIGEVIDGLVQEGEADDYVAEEDADAFDNGTESDAMRMTRRLQTRTARVHRRGDDPAFHGAHNRGAV